jgi:DNA polymerase-1
MKTLLLIDADVLAYQSAFMAQANIQWKEDLWTTHVDLAIAKTWIVERIETFKKRLQGDEVILAISDKNNFRRKLNPDYKANRRSKFAPIGLDPIRDWLAEKYGTVH